MIKSIITSREAQIYEKIQKKQDYSNFLNDISAIDKSINKCLKKYEERQSLSIKIASQIRLK